MSEMTFTRNNFEQEVLEADKPVIVDFWAPWCSPCRSMGAVISQLAEDAGDAYIVGKVNVDDEPELAADYGIMGIPTVKIFKNGRVTGTSVGFTALGKIRRMLE